jgi:hypothetical protein
MSLSSTLKDNDNKDISQMNIKSNLKKEYPSNPFVVLKDLINLNKAQKIRLLISSIIIILFAIFNNIQILKNPSPTNNCYFDIILDWTLSLSNYFRRNDIYRIIITITGSILLDTIFIVTCIYWAIYAIDWRYAANIIFFYFFRGILQQIIILRCPDLIYFKYPNFPSIVVGYAPTNDFFFSGHCGFPILAMMEFFWLKKYFLAGLCSFATIFEAFLLFNSCGYYTIDMIIGVIFAHYISIQGKMWMNKIYGYSNFLNGLKMENIKELKRINAVMYY